jgi:hypothetical protein
VLRGYFVGEIKRDCKGAAEKEEDSSSTREE